MRVMLVEDDPSLNRGLQRVLQDAGHQVLAVDNGQHADTLLATESVDLVVLDLGLPGMDGLAVLHRLRQRRATTPVLILSARDRTEDRVRGLDSGADDYLSKPFELSEFEARVRALLRRGQGARLKVGELEWSWDERALYHGDQVIALTGREAVLLEALLQRPGRVVPKEALASRMSDGLDAAGDNTVEVYVHRLRRKLAGLGVEIRVVRGLGYLLRETNDA